MKRSKIIEKTGIPEGNIDRRLNHLRAIGAVSLIGRKYQAGPEPQDEKVFKAMKQLKAEGFHYQSYEMIANMAGLTDEEVEIPARRLAPRFNVFVGHKLIKTDISVDYPEG